MNNALVQGKSTTNFIVDPQTGTVSTKALPEDIDATNNALHVLQTNAAGFDQARDVLKNLPEMNYTVVNATGLTIIKNSPGTYFGYKVTGAAGAHTLTVYDNTAASGTIIENGVSVASAANSILSVGIKMTTGIAVNMSGDPTDGLILVFWR